MDESSANTINSHLNKYPDSLDLQTTQPQSLSNCNCLRTLTWEPHKGTPRQASTGTGSNELIFSKDVFFYAIEDTERVRTKSHMHAIYSDNLISIELLCLGNMV